MAKLARRKIIVPKTAGTVKMSEIEAAVKQVRKLRLQGKLPKLTKKEEKIAREGVRLRAPR